MNTPCKLLVRPLLTVEYFGRAMRTLVFGHYVDSKRHKRPANPRIIIRIITDHYQNHAILQNILIESKSSNYTYQMRKIMWIYAFLDTFSLDAAHPRIKILFLRKKYWNMITKMPTSHVICVKNIGLDILEMQGSRTRFPEFRKKKPPTHIIVPNQVWSWCPLFANSLAIFSMKI